MSQTFQVNEVFYSLQGEGLRAGTANVFVRFSGCNLTCRAETEGFDCDTEFTSGRRLTREDLLAEAIVAWEPQGRSHRAVVFTGGEPGLQLTPVLVEAFREADFYCAVETNGTVDLSGVPLDWICVSPKSAEHTLRQRTADELKYVRRRGQGIPRPTIEATNLLISPAYGNGGFDADDIAWCIALVKDNPQWRLSMQQHKVWGVR